MSRRLRGWLVAAGLCAAAALAGCAIAGASLWRSVLARRGRREEGARAVVGGELATGVERQT